MHRLQFLVAPTSTLVRSLTGYNTVLGTGTLPQGFVKTLQEDLNEEEIYRRQSGIGETLRNCIRHSDLDHIESPESDAAHLQKVESMMENLFSKIPLPLDPMKTALAPTEEELREREEHEVLKEAVREQYLRQKAYKAAEETRISEAMKRYEVDNGDQKVSSSLNKKETCNDSLELRRKIDDMKRQIEKLEKLLESKSPSSC
ncbi:uncharacterized protein TM35_000241100 [Trypanosoma theileri]|uniref:Uncharacterized protein n=1 Tax=Trypanosoma theileri TaxID=67003 RepID=A0A1X0NS70_9TRYP|nr:uncharacterized protein TM35_000241100 [Trypanosoma theileri]ORC86960.1 hypothetical protein TM35_000241100 [Trypanosoma theileri]